MSLEFQPLPAWLNVSRETHEKLGDLLALVLKWSKRINLVSTGSAPDAWARHILDSAQLWAVAGAKGGLWLDVGSGGGFPGLVMAVLARDLAPDLRVCLVESDQRKCVFLREAARQLGLVVDVRASRIEGLERLAPMILTARAVAPLDALLGYAERQLAEGGLAIFPKGKSYADEVAMAQKNWRFDCQVVESMTDSNSVVLKIENIRNA